MPGQNLALSGDATLTFMRRESFAGFDPTDANLATRPGAAGVEETPRTNP